METKKRDIDWEKIEAEYRAGQISVAEISRQGLVSRAAIEKRAKRFGWIRNLSGIVRNEVETRLVAGPVTACNVREAIDAAAARGVDIVLRHRRDISRLNDLKSALANKAGSLLGDVADLKSLQDAAQAIESLSRTTHKLVALERQAFGLDPRPGDPAQVNVTANVTVPASDLTDDQLAEIIARGNRS